MFYCCIKNCHNNSKKFIMHSFPINEELFVKWVNAVQRQDLYLEKGKDQLRRCYRVCDAHFKDGDKFTTNANRSNLVFGCVPSVHLPASEEVVVEKHSAPKLAEENDRISLPPLSPDNHCLEDPLNTPPPVLDKPTTTRIFDGQHNTEDDILMKPGLQSTVWQRFPNAKGSGSRNTLKPCPEPCRYLQYEDENMYEYIKKLIVPFSKVVNNPNVLARILAEFRIKQKGPVCIKLKQLKKKFNVSRTNDSTNLRKVQKNPLKKRGYNSFPKHKKQSSPQTASGFSKFVVHVEGSVPGNGENPDSSGPSNENSSKTDKLFDLSAILTDVYNLSQLEQLCQLIIQSLHKLKKFEKDKENFVGKLTIVMKSLQPNICDNLEINESPTSGTNILLSSVEMDEFAIVDFNKHASKMICSQTNVGMETREVSTVHDHSYTSGSSRPQSEEPRPFLVRLFSNKHSTYKVPLRPQWRAYDRMKRLEMEEKVKESYKKKQKQYEDRIRKKDEEIKEMKIKVQVLRKSLVEERRDKKVNYFRKESKLKGGGVENENLLKKNERVTRTEQEVAAEWISDDMERLAFENDSRVAWDNVLWSEEVLDKKKRRRGRPKKDEFSGGEEEEAGKKEGGSVAVAWIMDDTGLMFNREEEVAWGGEETGDREFTVELGGREVTEETGVREFTDLRSQELIEVPMNREFTEEQRSQEFIEEYKDLGRRRKENTAEQSMTTFSNRLSEEGVGSNVEVDYLYPDKEEKHLNRRRKNGEESEAMAVGMKRLYQVRESCQNKETSQYSTDRDSVSESYTQLVEEICSDENGFWVMEGAT